MFLAVGPTGTGKSTLGTAIAQVIPGYDNLIRIDCSELATPGSTTRLVGVSHGYVGFDNRGGLLTTQVRKKRESVVLFDEIEKAHPDIHQLFLQIAEGRLTDGSGTTTDFSDTICIATSNVGAREMTRRVPGFTQDEARVTNAVGAAVKSTFSAEFLGRFDAILEFGRLPDGAQVDIAWKTWKQFRERMAVNGWDLDMDRGLLSKMVGDVSLHDKGARELERRIEFDVLADLNNHPAGSYTAVLDHSRIVWREAATVLH
jgi:ATP-dependent Clp protease ATP-binding subunit ClpA